MTSANAPQKSAAEARQSREPCASSVDAVAIDQRRRILEALPRAVAEHGFEATTVEHVVKLGGVRRNSFYEQFSDKRDCFAEAYEIAQERLLGVLTFRCYTQAGLANQIGAALGAGLDLLGTSPGLARLIVVEAPAAGEEIARRHQEWLDRFSRLLQLAAVDNPDTATPKPALEPAIVGAIISRIRQLILAGETEDLPRLRPELTQLTLSYYSSPARPPDPSVTSAVGEGVEPAQPQSPERRTVLEPA
jgi:TetR/AcrR family transcriptional regulator